MNILKKEIRIFVNLNGIQVKPEKIVKQLKLQFFK